MNKKLFFKILKILSIEIIMIIVMFILLLGLKAIGINSGIITKTVPFIVILLITTACTYLIEHKRLCDIGFRMHKKIWIAIIYCCILGLAPYIIFPDRNLIWDKFLDEIVYYVLVGLAEETFFRGYISYAFKNESLMKGMLTSAVAFAMLHFISSEEMTIFLFLLLILGGMTLYFSAYNFNSIIPIIVFHSIWDIFADYSNQYSNILFIISVWAMLAVGSAVYRRFEIRRNNTDSV
jgi:membrane protease YdiL (CAAX protease family)